MRVEAWRVASAWTPSLIAQKKKGTVYVQGNGCRSRALPVTLAGSSVTIVNVRLVVDIVGGVNG